MFPTTEDGKINFRNTIWRYLSKILIFISLKIKIENFNFQFQKFHFYVNSSSRNSNTSARCLGAILHSEITNAKDKNAKTHVAKWPGKGIFVYSVRTEGRCQQGMWALGDSNFVSFCAYTWMTGKEPQVLIWGNKLYIHILLNKSNSASLL